jgi:SAM-dependent methyltransferase
LDPDRLKLNSNLRCIAANGAEMPFANRSIDLIVSDNAFEHLTEPESVLSECTRVLKPGGLLIFATPHKYSYISLIAAVAPFRFHVWLKKLQGSSTVDVSETFYRLNTSKDLRKYCLAAGLEVLSLESFVGAPCYTLYLPPPLHLLMVLLHSFINRVGLFKRWFGITLVGVLQRPADKNDSRLAHVRESSYELAVAPKTLSTVLETR